MSSEVINGPQKTRGTSKPRDRSIILAFRSTRKSSMGGVAPRLFTSSASSWPCRWRGRGGRLVMSNATGSTVEYGGVRYGGVWCVVAGVREEQRCGRDLDNGQQSRSRQRCA
jgi:hypothetical protein